MNEKESSIHRVCVCAELHRVCCIFIMLIDKTFFGSRFWLFVNVNVQLQTFMHNIRKCVFLNEYLPNAELCTAQSWWFRCLDNFFYVFIEGVGHKKAKKCRYSKSLVSITNFHNSHLIILQICMFVHLWTRKAHLKASVWFLFHLKLHVQLFVHKKFVVSVLFVKGEVTLKKLKNLCLAGFLGLFVNKNE